MTDDIVKRLRDEAHVLSFYDDDTVYEELFVEAADEIERLRKELALAQARIVRLEGLP